MKKTILFLFFGLVFGVLHAQKNQLGIRAGVVAVDLVGDYGLSLEFDYERKITNGLSALVNFGIIHFNSFPDYFDVVHDYVNGVPRNIHERIQSLGFAEASALSDSYRYNAEYIQTGISYLIPLRSLGFNIKPVVGVMLINVDYTDFSLGQYQIVDNRIEAYTPQYSIGNTLSVGWFPGIVFQKPITSTLHIEFDFKLIFPNADVNYEYVSGMARIGVSKQF